MDSASSSGAPRPVRCVVADDHPAIVDSVSRFLDGEDGIRVVGGAPDGDEALRLIEEKRPDVAVLDVRMPGLGGIEIARRLTSAGETTGVILYTGFPERALVIEALDAGACGFLLKEAPLHELVRAVRMVADGKTYVDPVLAGVLAGPDVEERLPGVTKREREVLRLLADGMRNEEVARTLSISPVTVATHVKKAMSKLEADTRTEAVATAIRQSLIQ
jgi:DNA-binding NarL/FixJ family response regulator